MAVQANTRKTDKIAAGSSLMQLVLKETRQMNTEKLLDLFHELQTKLLSIYEGKYGKYPKIENKPFYYFTDGEFYITDPARYLVPTSGGIPGKVEGVNTTNFSYGQLCDVFNSHRDCPIFSGYYTSGERYITNKDGSNCVYIVFYYSSAWRRFRIYNNGSAKDYWDSYSSPSSFGSGCLRLPISESSGLFNAVKYNLMPSKLTAFDKKVFALLVSYQSNGWLEWNSNVVKNFSSEFFASLNDNKVDDFEDLLFKKESIDKYIKDGKTVALSEAARAGLVQSFVNVDTERIALSPYEESRLTDPNGGHWDLWSSEAGKNETMIKFDTVFYGRNPVADVHHDGIVGIDFGTKSTVVTVQDGSDIIVPMRVGKGDYKKGVSSEDYENPTMIEFINLENFLSVYKSSDSRPETKWKDLTISHAAVEGFHGAKTGYEYYAWFSDLKQWASDKNRTVIIRDKQQDKPKEIELVPFAKLSSADLNPIEIYAYMLGLFINNMYNGIYLNYILSFPVTYERKIRMKIAESFSDGLKKSLPKAVRSDKNIMNLFRVLEGASEPAAYAVCALQEYGFEPKENEKILYGIFDFGGGTTDFDFGTWERAPKKLQRRYDYVIRHFGAGGDRHLGGENLLELLAYSVFKKNEAVLRKNEVQFIKPADADKYCGMFEGSEALISNSQQAKINHKKLAEELRPLWHGEEYSKEKVSLNFYNTKGDAPTVELKLNTDELKSLICKRIDSGVENFFEAMKSAVSDDIAKGVDKIHIFLAGNSSKSSMVVESFSKYIKIYEPAFAKKFNIKLVDKDSGILSELNNERTVVKKSIKTTVKTDDAVVKQTLNVVNKSNSVFVLYPPLGTKESDEIRKKKGLTVSSSVARPTGKTGVAYGLLECRPGSRVKVESEIKETDEIKFNFYTGYASMGKFEVLTDRDIEYGKWIEFIDAGEYDFELYYTNLPEAVGNKMSIHGVSKKNCRIDETRDDAMVYIRAVEPSVMEYCAAFGEEELSRREYLSPPKRIILE